MTVLALCVRLETPCTSRSPGAADRHPSRQPRRHPRSLISSTIRKRSWWIRLPRSVVAAMTARIHRRSRIHRATGDCGA